MWGPWRLLRFLSPIYWLVHWPPSRKQILAFLLVNGLLLGTVFPTLVGLDRPEDEATIEEVDVTVRLNDETSWPDGLNDETSPSDGVVTCMSIGPPGDHFGVIGTVEVDVPVVHADGATVVVSLAHADQSTVDSVDGAGFHESRVFWTVEDDESLSVGDDATIQVWVRSDGETIAAANRTVPVENGTRTYDC